MRRHDGRRINIAVELTLLIAIAIAMIPIAWGTLLAFQPNRAITNPEWDFSTWFGNFHELMGPGQPFLAQIANSIGITLGTVVLCLTIGSISGYALAKLHPPRWLMIPAFILAVFVPLVPPMTLVPGMYVQMSSLGLINSVPGLIILNTVLNLPFAVLLMKTYFDNVPEELREAAFVDGASQLRAFFAVVLPLVRPGLAAVGIFIAIMAWNEFLFGLTMTSGGSTAPITVGIASLVQPYAVTWGEMSAAGAMVALPIIVVAIVANRQIVSGLTSGSVKG